MAQSLLNRRDPLRNRRAIENAVGSYYFRGGDETCVAGCGYEFARAEPYYLLNDSPLCPDCRNRLLDELGPELDADTHKKEILR